MSKLPGKPGSAGYEVRADAPAGAELCEALPCS